MAQNTLTVIALDAKYQKAEGATVSIQPGDQTAVTNSAGEAQLKLGTSTKYMVTVTVGKDTVTVPYYMINGGATRLVVGPAYVKSVEQKLHPSWWVNSGLIIDVGIGLGIAVILVVVWKLFFKKIKRNKK